MTVVVRPYRAEHRELLWRHFRARSTVSDRNAGRRARRAFLRRFEASGTLTNGLLELAIEVDGRLVGDVQARQPEHALPPGVFELGIDLFEERDRGRGYGAAAVAEVTRILFDDQDAVRVQASTAVDNHAMRRVLERVGFSLEGVLRGFWRRDEGVEDYALYAMTRRDWLERPSRGTF